MAIIIRKNIKLRNQSPYTLKKRLNYIKDHIKTYDSEHNIDLVSGINCIANRAFEDFMRTKKFYRKTSGRYFEHYIQSFSKEDVLPSLNLYHQIGIEFAKKAWPDFEIVVSTHINHETIHNHFIINSVSYKTGKKIRNFRDFERLKTINDTLMEKYALSTCDTSYEHSHMNDGEFFARQAGISWKQKLVEKFKEIIESSMSFIEMKHKMEHENYKFDISSKYKNIMLTTPGGHRCQSSKIYEPGFSYEQLKKEFIYRREIRKLLTKRIMNTHFQNNNENQINLFDSLGVEKRKAREIISNALSSLDSTIIKEEKLSNVDVSMWENSREKLINDKIEEHYNTIKKIENKYNDIYQKARKQYIENALISTDETNTTKSIYDRTDAIDTSKKYNDLDRLFNLTTDNKVYILKDDEYDKDYFYEGYNLFSNRYSNIKEIENNSIVIFSSTPSTNSYIYKVKDNHAKAIGRLNISKQESEIINKSITYDVHCSYIEKDNYQNIKSNEEYIDNDYEYTNEYQNEVDNSNNTIKNNRNKKSIGFDMDM